MAHHIIGHIGLAGANVEHKRQLAARATCNLLNGDLYTYPTSSSTVDASQPLAIKWDTQCSMSSTVDVYLYAPASTQGLVQGWKGADFSKGELDINLNPSWWNSTTTASLYVRILDAGQDPIYASVPQGPQFTVKYDPSTTTTTVNGQVTTSVKGPTVTNGGNAIIQTVGSTKEGNGISKGAIAAAVIVPIIFVAIITGVAVRFWRAREAEKRKRWSAAISTHSGLEWEKGARPGDKPASILGRPSTHFSYRPGSMATSSVYAVENNMAGAGAGGNFPRPSFQLRSHSAENVNSPDGNPRQSRISFAETTRPDRRSRMSLGDNLRPTIGRLPGGSKSASELVTPNRTTLHGSAIADDDEDINISPSQMQGPHFGAGDMRRASQGGKTGRRSFMSLGGGDKRRLSTASAVSADDFKSAASARGSVDELRDMEAVMLMRRSMMSQKGSSPALSPRPDTDHVEALDNEDMPSTNMPAVPAPAQGTVAYGPDQMLAVYAARGKVSASPMPPLPSNGMRSFVHLNTGTVSSAAVEALPHPGPPASTGSSLTVPTLSSTGRNNQRLSGASEGSAYSEDADVGEAKR